MIHTAGRCALLVAFLVPVAFGQQNFDFKLLDKLAKNAKETTNITLDSNLIKLGSSLLGGDSENKELQDAIKGITGIVIRSFEYPKEGLYSAADLEPVRAFFKTLNWSKIVDVKSDEENSEIYVNAAGGNKLNGVAIVAAEPKEVTVIYIAGSIGADQIGALSGKFGIPDLNLKDNSKKEKGSGSGKKDENDANKEGDNEGK